METYSSDEQTEEAIKQWWRENGKSVVGGAVLGIAAVLGWQGWQAHVTQQGVAAAAVYDQMLAAAQGDPTQAMVEAEALSREYDATPYSALAELTLAKLQVEQGQSEEAMVHLRLAMKKAKLPEIREVAGLRLARLLAVGGKPEEALKQLDELTGFKASGEEVRGDILLAQGKRDEAKGAYQRALEAGGNRNVLQLKLDDLGG
ncbi:YfgM family protein [Endothiovibrio diazotrophicus]